MNAYRFENIAAQKQWNADKQVSVLLEYIENQHSDEAFMDFLDKNTNDENDIIRDPVYKTVVTFTVLSREADANTWGLEELMSESDSGAMIGQSSVTYHDIVPAENVRDELIALSNDGTFFDVV